MQRFIAFSHLEYFFASMLAMARANISMDSVLGKRDEIASNIEAPKKKARFEEPVKTKQEELKWSYHVNSRINIRIGWLLHVLFGCCLTIGF